MNIATYLVVFVIVWWLILFMLLPVGVRQEDNPDPGHDTGAPKHPHIGKKLLVATLISIVITAAYGFMVTHGYFDFIDFRGSM